MKQDKEEKCGKSKLGWLDMQLIKLSIVVLVLFVISFFSSNSINEIVKLKWVWLLLLVIFMIKPIYKFLRR